MKKYINIFGLIIVSLFFAFLFSSCNNSNDNNKENLIEDVFYMINKDVLEPNVYFKFENIDGTMHWSDNEGESGICDKYTNNSATFSTIEIVNAEQTYKYHVTVTATVENSGRMKLDMYVAELNKNLAPYYYANSNYRPDNMYFYIVYYDTLHDKIVKQDTYNVMK